MGNCFLYKRGSGSGSLTSWEEVKEVVGSLITLTDAANRPLKGLRIFGKTTQNGTPTPDAPVPLVSAGDGGSVGVTVAGKNLFDEAAVTENKYLLDDGSLEDTGGSGAVVSDFIPVTEGYSYYISATSSHRGKYYNAEKAPLTSTLDFNVASGKAIVPPSNACYVRFTAYPSAVAPIQMEYGSTATEYEPYKEPQTLTLQTPNGLPGIHVSEGGNYTDADGQQWICDEVDFAGGKYIQRVNSITHDGTEAGLQYDSSYNSYILPVPNMMRDDNNVMCISSHAEGRAYNSRTNSKPNIYADAKATGLSRVFIRGTGITDIDSWKAFLAQEKANGNPFKIIYILETPIITDLSSEELAQYAALRTLNPTTTIYNDGGADMEVKYITTGG